MCPSLVDSTYLNISCKDHLHCFVCRGKHVQQRSGSDSEWGSNRINIDLWLDPTPTIIKSAAAGTGGGGLELVAIEGPIVKVRITGPAASVMTVRVAVTQKLREKFPAIAAVQLVN